MTALLQIFLTLFVISMLASQIYSSSQVDKLKIDPYKHWYGISVWAFIPIIVASLIVISI